MAETITSIVKVYGTLNGQPLTLYPITADKTQWSAVVPKVESGSYVVELYAVDTAGNESHYATAIYTIDEATLHATITMRAVYLNGAEPLKIVNTRYRE